MKVKIEIFIFLLVILFIPLFSQNTFNKTYNNSVNRNFANSIIELEDGNFLLAGEYDNNALLMKIDDSCDTIWYKTYGGVRRDNAKSVIELDDQNLLFTGYSSTYAGMWIVKTNSTGDTLWSKVFPECGEGQKIIETLDGNYVITGTTPNPGGIDYWMGDNGDIYCIKINESGEILWQNTYDLELSEIGFSAAATSDSGCVVSVCEGVKLLRLNSEGDTLWSREYSHNQVPDDMFPGIGFSVLTTANGGFLITGVKFAKLYYDAVYWCGWLINTNFNGDTLWTNTILRTATTIGESSIQVSDGNFITLFYLRGGNESVMLAKISPSGNIIWENMIAIDRGRDIIETSDKGLIIIGEIGNDISVIKTDSSGVMTSTSKINNNIIESFQLYQNYPNPFNPTTTIEYAIPEDSYVKLSIFDISGQLIETLVDELNQAGTHKIIWNASKYSSGIYISRLESSHGMHSRKMVLIK